MPPVEAIFKQVLVEDDNIGMFMDYGVAAAGENSYPFSTYTYAIRQYTYIRCYQLCLPE